MNLLQKFLKSIIPFATQFYFWIFSLLAGYVLLCSLINLMIAFTESPVSYQKIMESAVMVFSFLALFYWAKTFKMLTKWLKAIKNTNASDFPFKTLSRYLCFIFIIDLIYRTATHTIFPSHPFAWEKASLSASDPAHVGLTLVLFFLKMIKYGGPFVLPQTTGSVTLLCSGILHIAGERTGSISQETSNDSIY